MAALPPIVSANAVPYSVGLWTLASGLSKVHTTWKWITWGNTYTNKDNILGLGVGHALDFMLPDSTILKMPAVPFLIGSRLLDLFSQEDALKTSYQRWKEAAWFVIPVNPKVELVKKSSLNIVFSRYTITWWKTASLTAAIRTQRIFMATLSLGFETFKLTMRIMDIVELVTLDPVKINMIARQSLQEGGVHVPRCLNAMVRNKHVFLERLHNPQNILNCGIKALGSDPEQILAKADDLFEHLGTGLDAYKAASETVGDATVAFIKKGAGDIASLFISPELVHEWFFDPQQEANWWHPITKKEGRLIPAELITAKNPKHYKSVPVMYTEILVKKTSNTTRTPSTPPPNLYAISKSPSKSTGRALFTSPVKQKSRKSPHLDASTPVKQKSSNQKLPKCRELPLFDDSTSLLIETI